MVNEFDKCKTEIETASYYKSTLKRNYIYKGPDIEKELKKELYVYNDYNAFESLIPKKGNIYELGSGYGFFSYILSLTSKERTINSFDLSEEKISIANNCTLKSELFNSEDSFYDS